MTKLTNNYCKSYAEHGCAFAGDVLRGPEFEG